MNGTIARLSPTSVTLQWYLDIGHGRVEHQKGQISKSGAFMRGEVAVVWADGC